MEAVVSRPGPNPLLTLLSNLQAKGGRQPRWEGDTDALAKALTPEQQQGFEVAIVEMRKALFPDHEAVRKAYVDLLTYCPGFYPPDTPVSDVDRDEDWATMPFFSETYLYNLLGKDQARSVLGRIYSLGEAVGVQRHMVMREVNEALTAIEAERQAANERLQTGERRRKARAERFAAEIVDGNKILTHDPDAGHDYGLRTKPLPWNKAKDRKTPAVEFRAKGNRIVMHLEDGTDLFLRRYLADVIESSVAGPLTPAMGTLEAVNLAAKKSLLDLVERGALKRSRKYESWIFTPEVIGYDC